MKKLPAIAAAIMLIGTACMSSASDERTILVDYSHDEFASFIAENFPRRLSVHPGTELVFRQTWTGEPHSVTGGTLADELMEQVEPYIEKMLRGEEIPEEPPKAIAKLEKRLPKSFYEDESIVGSDYNQTAAQPCYLTTGDPPTDRKPCKTQVQPEFTGKHSYYNSGLIPYEGPQGNEHRVKLADDISPGAYWFYCNVHSEFQSTKVVVKPRSEKVDTQVAVNKRAREQITTALEPALKVYERAKRDREIQADPEGKKAVIKGNFAGLFDPVSVHWHSINEFVPRRMTVKAGEKITWNVLGFHTISFGVPKYFPVLTFEKDGTVKRNLKADPVAGGAKVFKAPGKNFDRASGRAYEFDAGTYDGNGFWSSGTINGDLLGGDPVLEYSMRITKSGIYRYACLIHPPMVGTLEVT